MEVTDAQGHFTLEGGELESARSMHLGVRAQHYLSRVLPVADLVPNSVTTLRLEKALSQSIRCVNQQGDPVPGVQVVLSPVSIDNDWDPAVDRLPGFEPVVAIHRQCTGDDGIAVFHELDRRSYTICLIDDYHEAIAQYPLQIEEPGPEFTVVLTPLLAGVIDIQGDQLVSYNTTNGSELLSGAPHRRSLNRLKHKLTRQFPNGVSVVGGSALPVAPVKSVIVDLLLAKSGPRRVELFLQPYAGVVSPVVIAPESAGPVLSELVELDCKVLDLAGFAVPEKSKFFMDVKVGGITHYLTLPGDGKVLAPLGTWRILTREDMLRKMYEPTEVEITPTTRSLTVQITNIAVPCRVRVRGHRGLKVEAGLVQLTQGIFSHSFQAADIEKPTMMLFPGEAELYFTSFGYEPIQRNVVIEVPPQGEYHWIELEAVPKPPR